MFGGLLRLYVPLYARQVALEWCKESLARMFASRSIDGQMIVATLPCTGVTLVPGSGRNRHGVDRGDNEAIDRLVAQVLSGETSFMFVDGPRAKNDAIL